MPASRQLCSLWLLRFAVLIAFSVRLPTAAVAQPITLSNVVKAGGYGSDTGYSVAIDPSGNTVVTGSFQVTATFGSGLLEVPLTSAGSLDMFVAWYAPDGGLLNAIRAGGSGTDIGRGVATDRDGHAVVVGTFEGSATFGSGASAITLTSTGEEDVFVARYAPDGTLVSAVRAGGAGEDYGRGVAVDRNGNAVIAGFFERNATFGSGASAVSLQSAERFDAFVARYAADGTLLHAVQTRDSLRSSAYGVATDGDDNAVVAGLFGGRLTLGAGASAVTLDGAGYGDFFVARYTPDGTLLNAVRSGGSFYDYIEDIAVDGSGNAVVIGAYYDGTTFGSGAAAVVLPAIGKYPNIFVARYAPDGKLLNVFGIGVDGWGTGYGVATDDNDEIVVTGTFGGSSPSRGRATFGSGASAVTLQGTAASNLFVAHYAADGTLLDAVGVDSSESIRGYGVATDGKGSAVVTGSFYGVTGFGSGTRPLRPTVNERPDAFIARYNLRSVERPTGVKPDAFVLSPPFPNPFNPTTTLSLSLPATAEISATLYDVLGRPMRRLYDGRMAVGTSTLTVQADGLASGVYVVRVVGADSRHRFSASRRVVLVR